MKSSSFDELEGCYDENFDRSQPVFRVLILFEDEVFNERAKSLYDHLFRNVKERCRLETFCWDLKHLDFLEELVEAITMADMIIVGGHDTSELPDGILTALKVGLGARRTSCGALVALLGTSHMQKPTPSRLHLLLQKFSTDAGLKFFPGAFEMKPFSTGPIPHRKVAPVNIDYGINE